MAEILPHSKRLPPPARTRLRRRSLLLAAVGAASLPTLVPAAQRRSKLVLAGPPAAVSYPLMRMVQSGALADWAGQVEFLTWKDPDQLRLLAIEGKADFVAMPTNVAANLFNRGVRLALLNVPTWGVLWILSRSRGPLTLADLKGQELLVPFRGDMPDIVLQLLAAREGIDLRRDIKLRYVGSPLDAMQMLLMRQSDNALLAEPAASMALRKTHSFPLSTVAPELYRAMDVQAEWGRVLQRAPQMPQAGTCVLGPALADLPLRAAFQQAFARALDECEAGPEACGSTVEHYVPQLSAAAVADAIRADNARFVTGRAARDELQFFFQQLLARQPGLVGGALPGDAFYAA